MTVAKNMTSIAVVNGIIYAFGGSLDAYTSTSDVELYDATTDRWTSKAGIPQKLCCTVAGTLNDKIYVFGGSTSILGTGYVDDIVYEYNPVTDTWKKKSDMPTPKFLASAIPATFILKQNYPNPFNPSTKIKYSIPSVETL